MPTHHEQIIDQFTHQAVPFSQSPGIADEAALALLADHCAITAGARALDVACGPGLVVRALAQRGAQVTGIDVTPAMIERARELTEGMPQVTLTVGPVPPLPYAADSFDVVVSRFAFHHFQEPAAVLAEMLRVCRPGGHVVVCDLLASDEPQKAAAFHAVEMVRDHSHAKALRVDELLALFTGAGLSAKVAARYKLPFELDALMARSFPVDGDRPALKRRYLANVDNDGLDLGLKRVGDEVHGGYRVVILRAQV
jgi:SAM-dependent methyltransferase